MIKYIKDYYKKSKISNLLFDFSLLGYFIAYFYYYQDEPSFAQIRFFFTIAILLSGVILCVKNQKYIKLSKSTIWYTLFFGFSVVSLSWSRDSSAGISIFNSLFRVIMVGFFISQRIKSKQDVEIVLMIYMIATFYMIVMISIKMIDYYAISKFYYMRLGDNFGYNSNMTSIQACFCLFICYHKIRIKEFRFINVLLVLFFVVSIVLTQSKKGLMGAVLGLVLMEVLKKRRSKKVVNLLITFCVSIVVIQILGTIPIFNGLIGERFSSFLNLFSGSQTDGSTSARIELIEQGLNMWYTHPIMGVGLNNFSMIQTVGVKGYYSHCNYVEILANLGIVGFFIYYWLPLKMLFFKLKNNDFLGVTLKILIVLIFFFDIAQVTYQNIQIVVLYWIFDSYTKIKKEDLVI